MTYDECKRFVVELRAFLALSDLSYLKVDVVGRDAFLFTRSSAQPPNIRSLLVLTEGLPAPVMRKYFPLKSSWATTSSA